MFVTHKAFQLLIDSIVENIMIEETSEAAQELVSEPQFQEEPDTDQDANLNSINSTTDQGKPRCIPPIVTMSLSHVYLYISMHLRFRH